MPPPPPPPQTLRAHKAEMAAQQLAMARTMRQQQQHPGFDPSSTGLPPGFDPSMLPEMPPGFAEAVQNGYSIQS